jgi:hypothetical protein
MTSGIQAMESDYSKEVKVAENSVKVKGGPWEGYTGQAVLQDGRFLVIRGDDRSRTKWGNVEIQIHEGQVEFLGPRQVAVVEADRRAWPVVAHGTAQERPGDAGAELSARLLGGGRPMTLAEVAASEGQLQLPGPEFAPGRKDDQGKTRYDLIPARALAEVAEVLTYGAAKYAPDNWRKVPDPHPRYYAAGRRHDESRRAGELLDPDSGRHHLAHAICCLLFRLELDLEAEEKDPPF